MYRRVFAVLALVALTTACGGSKEPTRKQILVTVPSECEEAVYQGASSLDSQKSQVKQWVERLQKDPRNPLSERNAIVVYPWEQDPTKQYQQYNLTCDGVHPTP